MRKDCGGVKHIFTPAEMFLVPSFPAPALLLLAPVAWTRTIWGTVTTRSLYLIGSLTCPPPHRFVHVAAELIKMRSFVIPITRRTTETLRQSKVYQRHGTHLAIRIGLTAWAIGQPQSWCVGVSCGLICSIQIQWRGFSEHLSGA